MVSRAWHGGRNRRQAIHTSFLHTGSRERELEVGRDYTLSRSFFLQGFTSLKTHNLSILVVDQVLICLSL